MVGFAFWNRRVFWISVSLLGLFGFATEAAAQQALNKTVKVTFSFFVPADCADRSTNRYARDVTQEIYVSTKGRLFAKLAASAGRASAGRMVEPSRSGQFRLAGNQIVGVFVQASGAVQETITFDSSYQSCTAELLQGSEAGKTFSWVNLVGVKCDATGKGTFSNVACSVQQGNAFAN